jgi:hypothetical protein
VNLHNPNNSIRGVSFDESYIHFTFADGRKLLVPLDAYPWLGAAAAEQRAAYRVGDFSVQWPELEDGIDLEGLLLGEYIPEYVSVQDMADMTGVAINTIQRILRDDQHKPEGERRIPGAYKEGDERRGEWRIPRQLAEQWERDTRGRKAQVSA